jgi:hypothetical protein
VEQCVGVKAGQPVLSEAANEERAELIQILGAILEHLGIKLDNENLGESHVRKTNYC